MARRIKLTTKLSVDELEQRYRRASEGMERSHWQLLWLLAQGHPAYVVAQMTGYSAYWIGQVARRYNDEGAQGLVNHRRRAHRPARRPDPRTLLPTAQDREELQAALLGPAPQDDVWNSRTVAAWLSARAGRRVSAHAALHYLRLLDFTPQAPRPRHTKAASPEERAAWKKSWKPR
jgi:transposase